MTDEKRLIERRRFLRQAATVAWATPVILTVSASAANATNHVSCVAAGSACGVGSPTPTNPCCDTAGNHCCCQETKNNGTVTRKCVPVGQCVNQGQTLRSCIPGL